MYTSFDAVTIIHQTRTDMSKPIAELEEGDCIMIRNCPCQVEVLNEPEDTGTSDYKLETRDVLTGKQYTESYSSDSTVQTTEVMYEDVTIVSHPKIKRRTRPENL